ncbi:MAG: NAD-dependent epimerase/dehydratase family protein [Bacteroidales bacterium]|nr:NAD-dependent epimerase/dehydratase family protein [Bacteroidales bacterium]
MRILLTGATGLLGNNVLEQLLLDGYEVTALVRDPSRVVADVGRFAGRYGLVTGDLTNLDDLRTAAKGCEGMINCAGVTDMTLRRLEDYYPINRDLCGLLLQVAQEENMGTIVHVSTADTIGYGSEDHDGGEEMEMCAPFTQSYYALSKREGEDILLHAAKEYPQKVVIINPGYIIGRYDVRPSSGRLLLTGWRRRLMAAPPGGKSFVGARTVAQAAAAALSRGRSGERYLVTAENLTFKQLYELQAHIGGYRQRVLTLPRWLCKVVGAIGDALATLGMRVEFTSRNVNQLLIKEYYSSQKAVVELGIKPQPIEEAVREFLHDRGIS